MGIFHIRKGRNIPIPGAANPDVSRSPLPGRVAVQPTDFRGVRPRLRVHEGDGVKAGSPVFEDKDRPGMVVVSPVSGRVVSVDRGEKRVLLRIVIETDSAQDKISFRQFQKGEVRSLSRQDITAHLLKVGLWPCIRQRPFNRVADPEAQPKALFVQAMNTEPLAPDMDFLLRGKEALFQMGLDIVSRLTDGETHLCFDQRAQSRALINAQNVNVHRFSGPHPTGNVSTHIHYVDPIRKGEVVWYLTARDVLRIAALFLEGVYPSSVVVALTGEGVKNPHYVETVIGTPLRDIFKDNIKKGHFRVIGGSPLNGWERGMDGYLGFYDAQLTLLPEGGVRRLLGWIAPGTDAYSFSKTFVSSFRPQEKPHLDSDVHGGHRAIVLNNIYDDLVTLDVLPYFLLRAVIAGDIEEAERLGILECDAEDFALCTFACPSKTDFGRIIQQGLEVIEREG